MFVSGFKRMEREIHITYLLKQIRVIKGVIKESMTRAMWHRAYVKYSLKSLEKYLSDDGSDFSHVRQDSDNYDKGMGSFKNPVTQAEEPVTGRQSEGLPRTLKLSFEPGIAAPDEAVVSPEVRLIKPGILENIKKLRFDEQVSGYEVGEQKESGRIEEEHARGNQT